MRRPDTASTERRTLSERELDGPMSTQRAITERIIRKPELLEITGVSIATLYRWIADGRFPAPVKLGPHAVGWRSSEVAAWLESLEPAAGIVESGGRHLDGETRERR